MSTLTLALSILCAGPAHAQADLSAVQDQLRALFHGGAVPAGSAVPKLTGAPLAAAAPAPANKALGFTLRDLSGASVSLSQFAGKYVLLDFSATWCGPCNASVPRLQELHENPQYKEKGLVVLAVYAEDAGTVRDHLAAKGASYRVVIDADRGATSDYRVRFYPTFFLIGPDGAKLGQAVGEDGIDTLVSRFEQAAGAGR